MLDLTLGLFSLVLLRLDLLKILHVLREEESFTPETVPDPASPTGAGPSSALYSTPKWLPGFLRHTTPPTDTRAARPGHALAWAKGVRGFQPKQRVLRSRRHAHHHPHHHAQLMRVGCVLGTCQVQNLSHRLYQLIGQSGREDSSPINPRSPHSYGWVRDGYHHPNIPANVSI